MQALTGRLKVLPVMLIAGLVTAACSETSTVPQTTAPLAGDFRATEAVFVDLEDPNNRFDVIAEQGTLDMTFSDNGQFTSTLTLPGRDPVVQTGTFDVQGSNTVAFTQGTNTRIATFEDEAGALRLSDPGAQFDFTGAGVMAPARLDASLAQR